MGSGRRRSVWALVSCFVVLALLPVVGFAFGWRPVLASGEGEGIDTVISYLLVVAAVFVVVGHGVLIYFLVRTGREDEVIERPSRRAEWMWALLPVGVMSVLSEVGVLILGSPVWASLYIEEPKDPFVVEVVGKQFEWISRYPGKDGTFGRTLPELVHDQRNPLGLDEDDEKTHDDIVKRGSLHLPLDRDIVIRLRTHDVIHSFFVPQMRVKQDLIPGLQTRSKFRPTRAGKYEIACAEYCGLGHYKMRAFLYVKPQKEFLEWLNEQEGWFED